MSKCKFAVLEIDYSGHIIFGNVVRPDPFKLQSMLDWPTFKTVKSLRSFFGLTGYYRKFIIGYGYIAVPLAIFLIENSFDWFAQAQDAFIESGNHPTTSFETT